ncbi:MAG: DUF2510 domain-containing protein [Anaerosomatales bacterium]|nr:DUF2510 domain-containing protein [Coriobacteriia bacterium]
MCLPFLVLAVVAVVLVQQRGAGAAGQAPTPPAPPAGWFADPTGRHELRYWNGLSWTASVSDAGTQSDDPM